MSNIKYEIFRNRKKFNILNWLRRSNDISYQAFVDFLNLRSVMSPGEEYFNKALDLFNSTKQREEQFQENKKIEVEKEEVEVVKKETIPIEVEISIPEIQHEDQVKESKPKTRRSRKKKED